MLYVMKQYRETREGGNPNSVCVLFFVKKKRKEKTCDALFPRVPAVMREREREEREREGERERERGRERDRYCVCEREVTSCCEIQRECGQSCQPSLLPL